MLVRENKKYYKLFPCKTSVSLIHVFYNVPLLTSRQTAAGTTDKPLT